MSHVARVIEEKSVLDQNAGALAAFLAKGKPDNVDPDGWELLKEQHRIMVEYSDILGKRLVLFAK